MSHPRSRIGHAIGVAALSIATLVAVSPTATARPEGLILDTSGYYTCISSQSASAYVVAKGGNGGMGTNGDGPGGLGAIVETSISVIAERPYYVTVGGNGAQGDPGESTGGGGGGYSSIATDSPTAGPLLVAGGGGGAYSSGNRGGNGGVADISEVGGGSGGSFDSDGEDAGILNEPGLGANDSTEGGDGGAPGVDGATAPEGTDGGGGGAGFGANGGIGDGYDPIEWAFGGFGGGGDGGYEGGGGGGGWAGGGGGASTGGGGGGSSMILGEAYSSTSSADPYVELPTFFTCVPFNGVVHTIVTVPQLVVGALNVSVDAGQSVPASFRVLGLHGADSVSDVVLEYAGTSVWGDVFGPSLTPPTAPGSYVISVKSYKLTSSDPAYYTGQFKHSAVLSIRWVPTAITDPALVGLPVGNAVPVKYAASGASVTGDSWSVAVNGAPVSVAGGKLLTDPGAVLAVSGKGFRPYSAVRIFVTPTELASVWTDAAGSFAKSVTVPGTVEGAQNLQVNGYSSAGAVRSVNVALQVGTTRRVTASVRFDVGSTDLKASIETRLQSMLTEVPVEPWVIHLSVAASAAGLDAKSQAIAQARVNVVIIRLRAALEAAGARVEVDSVIWNQPGLKTSQPLQLRIVDVELSW